MTPKDHRRKLAAGEKRFDMLGHEVVVQFNDRELLSDILDLFESMQQLSDEGGNLRAARISLDMIGKADEIVTRAVGDAARAKLWKGNPIREPLMAFRQLVEPATVAYESMFADYLEVPAS